MDLPLDFLCPALGHRSANEDGLAPDVISVQDAGAGEALLEWEGDTVFPHEEVAGSVSDRQAGRECFKWLLGHIPPDEKEFGKEKARLPAELDAQLLAEPRLGKENNRFGTVLCIGSCTQNKRHALQGAVGCHGVDLLCGLIGDVDLGRIAQIELERCTITLNQSARGCLDVHHRHARQSRVQIPGPGQMERVGNKRLLKLGPS